MVIAKKFWRYVEFVTTEFESIEISIPGFRLYFLHCIYRIVQTLCKIDICKASPLFNYRSLNKFLDDKKCRDVCLYNYLVLFIHKMLKFTLILLLSYSVWRKQRGHLCECWRPFGNDLIDFTSYYFYFLFNRFEISAQVNFSGTWKWKYITAVHIYST